MTISLFIGLFLLSGHEKIEKNALIIGTFNYRVTACKQGHSENHVFTNAQLVKCMNLSLFEFHVKT